MNLKGACENLNLGCGPSKTMQTARGVLHFIRSGQFGKKLDRACVEPEVGYGPLEQSNKINGRRERERPSERKILKNTAREREAARGSKGGGRQARPEQNPASHGYTIGMVVPVQGAARTTRRGFTVRKAINLHKCVAFAFLWGGSSGSHSCAGTTLHGPATSRHSSVQSLQPAA